MVMTATPAANSVNTLPVIDSLSFYEWGSISADQLRGSANPVRFESISTPLTDTKFLRRLQKARKGFTIEMFLERCLILIVSVCDHGCRRQRIGSHDVADTPGFVVTTRHESDAVLQIQCSIPWFEIHPGQNYYVGHFLAFCEVVRLARLTGCQATVDRQVHSRDEPGFVA